MSGHSTILWRIGIFSGVLLLAVPPFATGQPDTQNPEPSLVVGGAGKESSKTRIVYRPPCRDAPARRVGGGTRGADTGPVVVGALAREKMDVTIKE